MIRWEFLTWAKPDYKCNQRLKLTFQMQQQQPNQLLLFTMTKSNLARSKVVNYPPEKLLLAGHVCDFCFDFEVFMTSFNSSVVKLTTALSSCPTMTSD